MKYVDHPPIIRAVWIDSASVPGWQREPDNLRVALVKCESVGYLVEENNEGICLAQNRSITKDARPFGDLMSIPKAAILSKKRYW